MLFRTAVGCVVNSDSVRGAICVAVSSTRGGGPCRIRQFPSRGARQAAARTLAEAESFPEIPEDEMIEMTDNEARVFWDAILSA